MGNRIVCGGAPQTCVDECARLHFEKLSREADEPECDPAGAVFQETLNDLSERDREGLLFAGTSNLVAVRWLMILGSNSKARDRNGTTMLHAACRSGSFLMVQELLKRELPVDAADTAGWTPLHVAAMMGRKELTISLLQALGNPHTHNKRGSSPLDLCSDVSTREALRNFIAKGSALSAPEDFHISRVQGEVGEDPTATCEPFFVPRQPVFEDEANFKLLLSIGLDMAQRSAAHALAFFVATGVVHDHPTDLSAFLIEHKVDAAQLGSFMGEDFSLAQTLRLAFVHTMDLAGTGVVGALRKVFSYMRPPRELHKIDRITTAAAHLWWRTHDLEDSHLNLHEVDETLQWALYAEGGSTVDEDVLSSSWSVNHGEVCGARLRSVLHSVEGLSRLLFSTLMLCWNIRRVLPDEVEENARRLSFQEWTEINAKIEADGTTPSIAVQKCIYNALLQDECLELLPEDRQVDLEGLKAEMFEAPFSKGHLQGSFEAEDVTLLGWASIPTGGLERYELMPNGGHPGGGFSGAKLSHCILSETSSSFMGAPPVHQELSSATGEAVWMCLKHKAWLFLSTAPSDAAPYAFIRLQDSVLRETNFAECSVVLAGRKRLGEDAGGPFGDGGRLPLQLCFLLADGRFQLFEAVWLQLQFPNDEDLQHWSVALADACASDVTPQLPNGDGWI